MTNRFRPAAGDSTFIRHPRKYPQVRAPAPVLVPMNDDYTSDGEEAGGGRSLRAAEAPRTRPRSDAHAANSMPRSAGSAPSSRPQASKQREEPLGGETKRAGRSADREYDGRGAKPRVLSICLPNCPHQKFSGRAIRFFAAGPRLSPAQPPRTTYRRRGEGCCLSQPVSHRPEILSVPD